MMVIMIKYRKATDNDLTKLLGLIEAGFSVQFNSINQQEGQEHRVLFSYLYSLAYSNLERVYLAEDQELVAAVGLFPQHLFFEKIKIPVWAISPVVTHPNYRGMGTGGSCLAGALEDLKQQDIPAVFLWGLPDYYPRFGFVPLLPRLKTRLTKEQLNQRRNPLSDGGFRNVTEEDIASIYHLYNQGNHLYWLQPERSHLWWRDRLAEMDIDSAYLKEVPFPQRDNFMVWENPAGHVRAHEISGYFYYESIIDQKKIIISEGMANDCESALAMMQTFVTQYLKPDWTLYIRGTPEHFLNAAAYRLGGTHLNPAPLAGMVKVINWPCFFDYLKPLINERLKHFSESLDFPCLVTEDSVIRWRWNPATGIQFEFEKPFQPANPIIYEVELTRLLFGLYDQMDGLSFQDSLLKKLFPVKYPFIWDANYLY